LLVEHTGEEANKNERCWRRRQPNTETKW